MSLKLCLCLLPKRLEHLISLCPVLQFVTVSGILASLILWRINLEETPAAKILIQPDIESRAWTEALSSKHNPVRHSRQRAELVLFWIKLRTLAKETEKWELRIIHVEALHWALRTTKQHDRNLNPIVAAWVDAVRENKIEQESDTEVRLG